SGQPHIDFDYTPKWTSVPWGRPGDFYINDVTFPKVLRDKPYKYHVFKGDEDLGVREPYEIRSDGSQTVNILEYHRGYGILETNPIVIYLLDPDTEVEYKLTEWQKK
ncbi:fungal immunomodulatory protein, partial [Rickenella mellea]